LQPSQLTVKKYENTGRPGHKPTMLPTLDPFWGGHHGKVKKQESKFQSKTEGYEDHPGKIGTAKKQYEERL